MSDREAADPNGLDGADGPIGTTDALAVFERERPRLVGLAYRLLGSLADAEDVVQEAWIRWSRTDTASIERPAAWLTTTVGRLGLDRLRARRRAQVDYVGPWLPEPLVRPLAAPGPPGSQPSDDPADHAELADSLTTAFLVLLERLTPEERLVLLLADVFGEPFPSVAATLHRSPDATRQLAVRARRKLADGRAPQDGRASDDRPTHTAAHGSTPRAEQLAIATAFVGAVMSGDLDMVRSMLDPDVISTSDGGPHHRAARHPIVGRDRVARLLVNLAKRVPAEHLGFEPVWVNGSPGVVVLLDSVPIMVDVIEIEGGRITRQYSIVNPEKLASIGREVDLV